MKQLVVLSGKGGTGKTSFSASFAKLANQRVILGDCDVDAANLALLVHGEDLGEEAFYAGLKAEVSEEACSGCLACIDVCRYDAINPLDDVVRIDTLLCEGCRACSVVCPASAISFQKNRPGTVYRRSTETGQMIHASLGIAEDNSGKLVARVRELALTVAKEEGIELVIIDGPPGIGCPVHAAMSGVDLVVAVTEPSSSGLHDLERMLELAAHFDLPSAVVINKYDLSLEITAKIEKLAKRFGSIVAGKVLFDARVPMMLGKGLTPLAVPEIKESLQQTWLEIESRLKEVSP